MINFDVVFTLNLKLIMKKILALNLLFIFSLSFYSCQKEVNEKNQKQGIVQFEFSVGSSSKAGIQKASKRDSSQVQTPAILVITIKNAAGDLIYNKESIELLNMNGSFISKPISLLTGGYTLEEFFVADINGNIIYASPLKGSKLAYLVNQPLPIGFSVQKEEVVKLVPEVLSVQNSTPEDFGYTTFSFNVVNTFDFLVGVFVYNETIQNFELTTATLTISADNKDILLDSLNAITTKVTLPDNHTSYILTVKKDGYNTYVDTLTAAELKLHYKSADKGPLEIILSKGYPIQDKSITMVTDQSTPTEIEIYFLFGNGDPLSINWGDSTIEQIIPITDGFPYFKLTHRYLLANQYIIKISGNSIQYLEGIYPISCQLNSIDVSEAENLTILNVGYNKIRNLDVSNNKKLTKLLCNTNLIETLNISNNDLLEDLDCSSNLLTAINLNSNINLKSINCGFNILNNLDVINNSQLEVLKSVNNNLTEINLTNNPELKDVYLGNNKLPSIDVQNNTKLNSLDCSSNPLTVLDLSHNTMLSQLLCQETQLNTIDLSNNKELTRINLSKTNISSSGVNNILSTVLSFNRYSNNSNNYYECSLWLSQEPTGQGIADMQTLQDTYKWFVNVP